MSLHLEAVLKALLSDRDCPASGIAQPTWSRQSITRDRSRRSAPCHSGPSSPRWGGAVKARPGAQPCIDGKALRRGPRISSRFVTWESTMPTMSRRAKERELRRSRDKLRIGGPFGAAQNTGRSITRRDRRSLYRTHCSSSHQECAPYSPRARTAPTSSNNAS
jgi:hypothetical protein